MKICGIKIRAAPIDATRQNKFRKKRKRHGLQASGRMKVGGPSTAAKEETKNGYVQVKYTWKKGDYSYTSRWHTRTPNAPREQGNSWVVERKKQVSDMVVMPARNKRRFWPAKISGYPNEIGRKQSWQEKRHINPGEKGMVGQWALEDNR